MKLINLKVSTALELSMHLQHSNTRHLSAVACQQRNLKCTRFAIFDLASFTNIPAAAHSA